MDDGTNDARISAPADDPVRDEFDASERTARASQSEASSRPASEDDFDATERPTRAAPKRNRAPASSSSNSSQDKPSPRPRSDFRVSEQPGFVLHSYPY